MSDPVQPEAAEARAPAPPRGESGVRSQAWKPRLVDLVDLETLQRVQDGFAELTGMATSIRDEQGRLITHPSCSSRFCELIGGALHDNEACRLSNYAAASAAAAEDQAKPVRYVCHAGLTQYAAAIRLQDRVLGTIVLGDVPEAPLTADQVRELAETYGLDQAVLADAAAELEPVPEERMQSAVRFLQLFASTITRLCWQQAVLAERIEELTMLAETSRLLSSTLEPDAVLDNIVRTMAEVMNVKACSLRLLNPSRDELVLKATHGLSPSYIEKGPVLVSENPNDQAALRGEVVTIPDMQADPHVRYGDAARREGLVSSLSVGLIAKGEALGTLHVYTGEPHDFTDEEIRLFRSVANQAALTVRNAQLVDQVAQARQQELELELAARVQARLLPARAPTLDGYDCWGITVPSLAVGGDLHDWIELPGGNVGVAVGDVAGKGVPGAILMASVRAALRAQAEHVYALEHVMRRVNLGLTRDTEPAEFATLFYGVLDSGARRFTYANAGHEPALLVRGDEMRTLNAGGPLLGVSEEVEYEQEAVDLEPGDTLVIYSDGACDAVNNEGERFGRQRLLEAVRLHAHHGARRAVEEIRADIRRFTGLATQADDLTLVVVKVL
jgi:sigma-B regulation protein RsbU (phosphoserine phosphatase)